MSKPHHSQISTECDGVTLTADVRFRVIERCVQHQRMTRYGEHDEPAEYEVTLTDIVLDGYMADRDGVEVEWYEDFTKAVVDALASDVGADIVDDDAVAVVEVDQ